MSESRPDRPHEPGHSGPRGGGLGGARDWWRRPQAAVIGAGAVAVVIVGALVWLLSGDGDDTTDTQDAGALLADDGGAISAPTQTPDVDLAAPSPAESSGDEPSTSGGSDSGGTSSGGSGGGEPANRPPVIEDPGLSSDGMLLTIAPTVSDPDGDDVTLLFEVNGETVDPATDTGGESGAFRTERTDDPTVAVVKFLYREVGFSPEASVAIAATDDRGAQISESFALDLSARTTVSVGEAVFELADPSSCFERPETSVALVYRLEFSGAIEQTSDGIGSVGSDGRVVIAGPSTERYEGVEPPPLKAAVSATLVRQLPDGRWTVEFGPRETGGPNIGRLNLDVARGTPCEGVLSFSLGFRVE